MQCQIGQRGTTIGVDIFFRAYDYCIFLIHMDIVFLYIISLILVFLIIFSNLRYYLKNPNQCESIDEIEYQEKLLQEALEQVQARKVNFYR